MIIITLFTLIYPPKRELDNPPNEATMEPYCNTQEASFLSSLVYNGMLVFCCSYFAFKTRKLPENYNESHFISLCVYCTIIVWIVFVPLYFTFTKYSVKVMVFSVAVLANATVFLLFLFVPKMFAVFCVTKADYQVSPNVGASQLSGTQHMDTIHVPL